MELRDSLGPEGKLGLDRDPGSKKQQESQALNRERVGLRAGTAGLAPSTELESEASMNEGFVGQRRTLEEVNGFVECCAVVA